MMLLLCSLLAWVILWVREHNKKTQEKRAACEHAWVHQYAMNDPAFPHRRCIKCGAQDSLDQCHRCGKVARKFSHEEPYEAGDLDAD